MKKIFMLFTVMGVCLLGCTSKSKEEIINNAVCLAVEETEIRTATYTYTEWEDTGVEKSFNNEPPITPTERWYFVRTINQEKEGVYGKLKVYAQQKRNCYEIVDLTTKCIKWDKKIRTGYEDIKVDDEIYSLWQTGSGEYPDRNKLDEYNIDFAIVCDVYDEDETGNWSLKTENKVIYFNNDFIDSLKIGDTWEQKNTKYKLKEWMIVPIKYENQNNELIRFASLSVENYIIDFWDQITPNDFRVLND